MNGICIGVRVMLCHILSLSTSLTDLHNTSQTMVSQHTHICDLCDCNAHCNAGTIRRVIPFKSLRPIVQA